MFRWMLSTSMIVHVIYQRWMCMWGGGGVGGVYIHRHKTCVNSAKIWLIVPIKMKSCTLFVKYWKLLWQPQAGHAGRWIQYADVDFNLVFLLVFHPLPLSGTYGESVVSQSSSLYWDICRYFIRSCNTWSDKGVLSVCPFVVCHPVKVKATNSQYHHENISMLHISK